MEETNYISVLGGGSFVSSRGIENIKSPELFWLMVITNMLPGSHDCQMLSAHALQHNRPAKLAVQSPS